MAKTYEELIQIGWSQINLIWSHKDGKIVAERQAGEADAEFRERMERATPGIVDFDWVTALRRAKNKRNRLQNELSQLEEEIKYLTEHVRKVSLWQVDQMEPMTWDEMMTWAMESREIKEIKVAHHDYRVEFLGHKNQGRPLLYVAGRIGWPKDMEGEDE